MRIIDTLFDEFTFSWISDEIAPHLPKEIWTLLGKEETLRKLESSTFPTVIWIASCPV